MVDFRAFYAAGHIMASREGAHLYNYEYQRLVQSIVVGGDDKTLPFLYPAYTALLFVPLSIFSYKVAFGVFWIINLLVLLAVVSLLKPRVGALKTISSPMLLCAFMGFFPLAITLMQGQVSLILLLIYTSCYCCLRRGRPFVAGLLLALALSKFQIAVPVAFLFFCWRRWRVFSGFMVGALAVAAISIALTGVEGTVEYVTGLTSMAGKTLMDAQGAKARYGMFPTDMPNLHGFFFALTRGSLVGQAMSALCSALIMFGAWRQKPSFAVALPAAMLVSYHMQPYDLTLLLLPLTLLISTCVMRKGIAVEVDDVAGSSAAILKSRARWKLGISVCVVTVPLAPVLLVHSLSCLFVLAVFGALWAASDLLGYSDSRFLLVLSDRKLERSRAVRRSIRSRSVKPIAGVTECLLGETACAERPITQR